MDEIQGMPGWYRVKKLGAGSYGTVYEIRKEEGGHVYRAALKKMSIPRDESEIQSAYADGMDEHSVSSYFQTLVDSISSECAMMYELSGNTNIVAYQGHQILPHRDGIGADVLIQMELLRSLTDYVSHEGMDEEQTIQLGIDLCRALELCEKKGIVHRDIKPANIFVNEYGDFKLGDFGIARTMSAHGTMTSKRGTYTYMAPEVYYGKKDYNNTADLYSLGLVLYWCMNNRRLPFEPESEIQLTVSIRDDALAERLDGQPIPRPRSGSDALWRVVEKATVFERADRFSGAREMRHALELCAVGVELASHSGGDPVINLGSDPGTEPTPIPQPKPDPDPTPRSDPTPAPAPAPKLSKRVLLIILAVLLCAGILTTAILLLRSPGDADMTPEPTAAVISTPAAETEPAETPETALSGPVSMKVSTDLLLVGDQARALVMQSDVIMDGASADAEWSSSDEIVATVTDGIVTGVAPGTTVISCVLNGESAEHEIQVVALDENSGVAISADYEGISMRSMESQTVHLTLKGNVPEHYGVLAYSSHQGIKTSWGTVDGENLELVISATIVQVEEGTVTVLLYPKEEPDHILAMKQIRIRLT